MNDEIGDKILKRIEDLDTDRINSEGDLEKKMDSILEEVRGIRTLVESLRDSVPSTKTALKAAVIAGMEKVSQPLKEVTQDLSDNIEKAHKTGFLDKLIKQVKPKKGGEK